jgi:hypothetical protein
MNSQPKLPKVLHVSLWIVQIVLAASLLWAAYMKLLQPIDQLAAMWPWAGQLPEAMVKLTGVVDLLGGLGLVLPAGLQIRPKLTFWAALGVLILMFVAGIFHLMRGEASSIGANIVFALMAAFVAWGRWPATLPIGKNRLAG